MNIAELRKLKEKNSFTKINDAFSKMNQNSYADARYWSLTRDKSGNASAVIRFLPATIKEIDGQRVEDELPFVKIYNHSFKGPTGQWYVEKSLTTLNLPDPVSEHNSQLWNSGSDADKERARSQKRRIQYHANILVVNDPANPGNNGKVFLFKFGTKILDKIMEKAQPTFDDEKSVNVFDLWEGCDFKLRMKTVENFPNYDSSEFASSKPISDDDEEILKIINSQYLLKDLIDPSQFKSYDELQAKYNRVTGNGKTQAKKEEDSFDEEFEQVVKRADKSTVVSSSDEDDTEAWFRKIAEEDDE